MALLLMLVFLASPEAALGSEAADSQPAPAALRPAQPPSQALQQALESLEAALSRTETGRRLLAETSDVPVVQRHGKGFGDDVHPGIPIRYQDAQRAIVVDVDAAAALTGLDFEAFFVRERRRAIVRAGIPLVEDEMAAHQEEVAFAVEKAEADADFSKRLRGAYEEAEKIFRSRGALEEASRSRGLRPLPPWRAPKDALALWAQEVFLYSEDPYLFYSAIEDGIEFSSDAVRLDEVSDFLESHPARPAGIEWRARGRYGVVGGRLYPGRVLRAALALGGREGILQLRERLGPFMSVQREELHAEVNRWIRGKK